MNNPYSPPRTPVEDVAGSRVDWRTTLVVWWSLMWRSIVYGALAGFALGAIAGVVAAALGHPERGRPWGAFAGWIGTFPASLLAVKQVLQKHASRFAALAGRR